MKILLLAALISCVLVSANLKADDSSDVTVHIISTTDLHGYIQAQKNDSGLATGGVDVMSGYFRIAKKADPNTLLLDSGDLFQGTIISNTTYGSTVVTWMNYAGYTASAIGNHEFDFGPGNGFTQVVKPGQDPLGALKTRESQAHFKFLSANTCSIDEDTEKCANPDSYSVAKITQPYLIQTVHGAKIGIIGLTTPSTPSTTLASNVSRLRFMPLTNTLEHYVPLLKSQGVDAIIVIVHEGGFCKKGKCEPTDPIFAAIDGLTHGTRGEISLILAGHTHSYVNSVYNGVQVLISGSYGRSFGYSTLTIHPTGQLGQATSTVTVKSQLVDFCSEVFPDTETCQNGSGKPVPASFLGQSIVPDTKAVQLISKDIAKADALAARVFGKLITPVTSSHDAIESSLGELMADAMRMCRTPTCTRSGIDVALQNNGGIRTKLLDAGPVTYGQIFQTEPFDNYYSVVELKGSQLHDLLTTIYNYNHGVFGQVSGIKIYFSKSSTTQRTITNADAETKTLPDPITHLTLSSGEAIQDSQIYHVSMADFLATGGDGTKFVLKDIQPAPKTHLDRLTRDVILDYFKTNPKGLDYTKLGGNRIIAE